MMENRVTYLTPDNAQFDISSGGFLTLTAMGQFYPRVSAIRAFPFTDPGIFISIRDRDMNEIGIIERLDGFDDDTVALLTQQINLRYFTPKITAIHSIKDRAGIATFDCETDKGHAVFSFRIGGESVARLNETRLIFIDLDGNRYEIADIASLPAKEQKKLDLYI